MTRADRLSALVVATTVACGGGGSGPTFTTQHPRIYLGQNGNKQRLQAALSAGGPAATTYQDLTDKWIGGYQVDAFMAWSSALLGQLTADPKYCTAAVAMIDTQVTTANAAIAMGNAPDVAGDDYLYIGSMIGDLALTYDWCYDSTTSDQRSAWLAYADQAVFNVWNPDQAAWGGTPMSWDGWAVDDPEDNYYYSFLTATMLLGLAAHDEAPMASLWLTEFHDTKFTDELLPKFNSDLVGGGSREGTSYGVSLRELFFLYDMWNQSTGEVLATQTPHTRASMLDFVHLVVPTLDFVAPTGDQARDSTAPFFDYNRQYALELVAQFPTDPLAGPIQALLAASSVPAMTERNNYVYDFLYENANIQATQLDGLGTAYYGSGTGQLFARSGWDSHATWVNFIAGPYSESHQHQDQGSFLIYKDGWLGYDANIDSHSGLRQEVEAHNEMKIGDTDAIPQKPGNATTLLALHKGTGYVHASADITPVFAGASQVQNDQRELLYLEPDCVVIYDRVNSTEAQTWQLATPAAATINGATAAMTPSGGGHTLNVQRLTPAGATSSIYDYTADSDYNSGFRLDEKMAAGDNRWLHVLWIDGAVGTAVANGADGVTITFSDGSTAAVTFNHDSVGGTLVMTPSGGSANTITLGAGVDTLPE